MNDVMKDYLSGNEKEVIDMFGFEWNEQEEREALLKHGKELGMELGEARGRINNMRDLLADGLISIEAIKATGRYSPEEIAAITRP